MEDLLGPEVMGIRDLVLNPIFGNKKALASSSKHFFLDGVGTGATLKHK